MSKVIWLCLVCVGWFLVEAINLYFSGGNNPIEWVELPIVIAVCIIAVLTFPSPEASQ